MDRGGRSQTGDPRSILRREAGVTCRGYDGILQRARIFRESRWHREFCNYSSLTEVTFCQGLFCALSESTRTAGGRRDRTDALAGTRFPARRKDGTGSGRSPRCECRAHVHRASSAREVMRVPSARTPSELCSRGYASAERTYTERAPLARLKGRSRERTKFAAEEPSARTPSELCSRGCAD